MSRESMYYFIKYLEYTLQKNEGIKKAQRKNENNNNNKEDVEHWRENIGEII